MVSCLAWAYVRFGSMPGVGQFLYGLKPVVIAIIAQGVVEAGPDGGKDAISGRGRDCIRRRGSGRCRCADGPGRRWSGRGF